jgi:hypothetical protein
MDKACPTTTKILPINHRISWNGCIIRFKYILPRNNICGKGDKFNNTIMAQMHGRTPHDSYQHIDPFNNRHDKYQDYDILSILTVFGLIQFWGSSNETDGLDSTWCGLSLCNKVLTAAYQTSLCKYTYAHK